MKPPAEPATDTAMALPPDREGRPDGDSEISIRHRPSAGQARPGEAFTILILGLLTSFGPVSVDMYLPALPAMAADFGTEQAVIQLSLSSFLLWFGLGQLFWGPLSDRFGRRAPAILGILVYMVACAGCAAAATAGELAGWRALQALGAGSAPVLARAMARDRYEGNRLASTLSLIWLVMGASPLVAPVLGSLVLGFAGWRAIFWVLFGFGALAMAGMLWIGETQDPQHRRGSTVRLLLKNYRSLLGNWRFLGPTLCVSCAFGGMFAYVSGSSFVFIDYFGLPASTYAVLFGMNSVGMVTIATINSRVVARTGPAPMLRLGALVIGASALALLAAALTGFGGMIGILVPMFVFMAMSGMVGSNCAALSLMEVPHMAGTASALIGASHFTVGSLTGTVVGLLADGTPVPMAAVICVMGLASLLISLTLFRR